MKRNMNAPDDLSQLKTTVERLNNYCGFLTFYFDYTFRKLIKKLEDNNINISRDDIFNRDELSVNGQFLISQFEEIIEFAEQFFLKDRGKSDTGNNDNSNMFDIF